MAPKSDTIDEWTWVRGRGGNGGAAACKPGEVEWEVEWEMADGTKAQCDNWTVRAGRLTRADLVHPQPSPLELVCRARLAHHLVT